MRRLTLQTGEVVEGFEVVKKVESFGSQSGATSKQVKISQSGAI